MKPAFSFNMESYLLNTNFNSSFPYNETDVFSTTAETFYLVLLASGILVGVFSVITIVGNGFLLLAIWKDPFKTFRIPPTVFIIGLAIADLLTGVVVAPVFAHSRIASYLYRDRIKCCELDLTLIASNATRTLSFLTMNASYLILLFLTWSQFSAIRYPHRHRVLITTRKVTICVVSVWIYALVFSLLTFLGVEPSTLYKVDFYMHTLVFMVLLTVTYCCLYGAFKTHTQRITAVTTERSTERAYRRISRKLRRRSERQFTIVTLVLVMFIILCTLPSTVLQFIAIYWDTRLLHEEMKLLIAREVSSDILFLKFALDPFVYCWRLTTYRKALKSILACVRTPTEQRIFAMSMRSVNEGRGSIRPRSNVEPHMSRA